MFKSRSQVVLHIRDNVIINLVPKVAKSCMQRVKNGIENVVRSRTVFPSIGIFLTIREMCPRTRSILHTVSRMMNITKRSTFR